MPSPLATCRASSHLICKSQQDEETLAGGGQSSTSAGPASWADFPCVLGLVLPQKGAPLPAIHPSLQEPHVELGLATCPAAPGSVRHSRACRDEHGPKVDTN